MKKKFDYQQYEILEKSVVAPETALFRLKGHIPFWPGQFVQAYADHVGEATFAICSDPNNTEEFELCIRGCGSTSNALIELLPGDVMKIRGPYGHGWPTIFESSKELVLIAGGMGLVPLRPLFYHFLRYKNQYKKLKLYVGARTPHHLVFTEDLREMSNHFEVHALCEHSERGFWGGKGMITEPLGKAVFGKNPLFFLCGPEVMYDPCVKILLDKGFKEKDIYLSYERRMECGVGLCQHCNIGKYLVCEDGPVFRLDQIRGEIGK
jgi:NAD(P)H-flavin reductase